APVVARTLACLLPDLRHAAVRRAAERIAGRYRARGVRRPECAAAGVPLLRVVQDRLGAHQRRLAPISGGAAGLDKILAYGSFGNGIAVVFEQNESTGAWLVVGWQ